MKFLTGLLLLISTSVSALDNPWAYTGTHYTETTWSGVIREPGGTNKFSVIIGVNDTIPADATLLSTTNTNLILIGGSGSCRDVTNFVTFMDSIETDPNTFIQAVQNRMNDIGTGVFVQIGNEISSEKCSEEYHAWLGGTNTPVKNDHSTIPLYAEYFFATATKGIKGSGNFVVLGSAANYSDRDADAWYKALLDYTLQGTFVPEYAGMQVRDLMDVASIHYPHGFSAQWEVALDGLRDFGIPRTWITEEVASGGRSGSMVAAVGAIRTFGRMVGYWHSNNLSPQQSRMIIFPVDILEQTSDEALSPIKEFFTVEVNNNLSVDLPLIPFDLPVPITGQTGNTEVFAYWGGDRQIVTFTGVSDASDTLTRITVFSGTTATMHLFDPVAGTSVQELPVVNGEIVIDVTLDRTKGGYVLIQ